MLPLIPSHPSLNLTGTSGILAAILSVPAPDRERVIEMVQQQLYAFLRPLTYREVNDLIVATAHTVAETSKTTRNQTVHDVATNIGVAHAVEALEESYHLAVIEMTDEQVKHTINEKLASLHAHGKLSPQQLLLARTNIERIDAREEGGAAAPFLLGPEERQKVYRYLKLAVAALGDPTSYVQGTPDKDLIEVNGRQELSPDAINERWLAWIDNALVDSQVAYLRDRQKGLSVEKMPIDQLQSILNKDASCFGGNLVRIIFGLNLLHPRVSINQGQETNHNLEFWKKEALEKDVNNVMSENISRWHEEFEAQTQSAKPGEASSSNPELIFRNYVIDRYNALRISKNEPPIEREMLAGFAQH